ncbi:hypothetical protein V1506DRAFT_546712 [Lipomyces tetrasporus]
MVTLPESRALLHYLNPVIDNWLLNSITTIPAWSSRTIKLSEQHIRSEVQLALSKVHFKVGPWTSPNALPFFPYRS